MTDTSGSFPARSLTRAINASLKLVNESADSLNPSQLSAIHYKLRETLRIIGTRIRDSQNEDQKIVIDLSDWEDGDTDDAADERMETSEETDVPLPIPGPYPMALPPGQATVDAYYVVDHGREVGIFTDNTLSTRAITGIVLGHQVEVKTWCEAATLYNNLRDGGLIVRVRQ